jgi:hypothetical protein
MYAEENADVYSCADGRTDGTGRDGTGEERAGVGGTWRGGGRCAIVVGRGG